MKYSYRLSIGVHGDPADVFDFFNDPANLRVAPNIIRTSGSTADGVMSFTTVRYSADGSVAEEDHTVDVIELDRPHRIVLRQISRPGWLLAKQPDAQVVTVITNEYRPAPDGRCIVERFVETDYVGYEPPKLPRATLRQWRGHAEGGDRRFLERLVAAFEGRPFRDRGPWFTPTYP
jgi:hypothetical protein